MAEVKNAFIKSKMNKDLDSRLLPSGEYRDGQNVQVSKSEGEDVGALENAIGNVLAIDFNALQPAAVNLKTIGLLSDTNSSNIYIFLTNNTGSDYGLGSSNYIYSYNSNGNLATLLCEGAFLNFSQLNPIYGINLLEDLLFWTDNRNQPRVLNVETATSPPGFYDSEDLISVAKYNPYEAINFYTPSPSSTTGGYNTTMKDVVNEFIPKNFNGGGNVRNPFFLSDYAGDPDYLKDKFVCFSYRFKFKNGEYSIMAPFSQEAFIPKQDGYFLSGDEDDAYRSTIVRFMENKVNNITLNIPLPYNTNEIASKLQVSEIEILYKESDSLNVKILDSILESTFNQFPGLQFEYDYQSRKPYRTLPESETIRVYDKVPVKALGQEVISNRIVYSNFQNKHTPPPTIAYDVAVTNKSDFNVNPALSKAGWSTSIVEYPEHTLKQNRNYQVGFILSDKYGRQSTTILSAVTGLGEIIDGVLYKGSTIYHDYQEEPTNITNNWPGDSLKILINDPITSNKNLETGEPGLYNGDITSSEYNPLGWYSYKIVVKQTEQEYYNVYLPGILNGYPNIARAATTLPDPENQIAHITLLGDNINKVPRNLTEVGPEQKQYGSEVELFGRVTPDTNVAPSFTKPYYPKTNFQTVVNISEQNNLFDNGGPLVEYKTVYQTESNPYIARLSQNNVNPFGVGPLARPIGSLQNAPIATAYNTVLGVFETSPVISLLDIFYETSTTGLISDLNLLAENQVSASGFNNFNSTWSEGSNPGTNITANRFSPVFSPAGGGTQIAFPDSTLRLASVNGDPDLATELFTLIREGKNANGVDEYNIEVNRPTLFSSVLTANRYTLEFVITASQTAGGPLKSLPKIFEIFQLNNIAPSIAGLDDFNVPEGRTNFALPIQNYVGANGATTSGTPFLNQTEGLVWEILSQSPNILTSLITIDQEGNIYEQSGSAIGKRTIVISLKDADARTQSGFASSLETRKTVVITFGRNPINETFGSKKESELSEGMQSTGLYWSGTGASIDVITDGPIPSSMANPAAAPPSGRVLNSETLFTATGWNNDNSIVLSGESTTDNSSFVDGELQAWRFQNNNYKPSVFDTSLGADSNADSSLTQGTAYIKLDFEFKSFPRQTLTGEDQVFCNSQFGVGFAAYLEYRPNSATPWVTAVDVEGNDIKFGSTTKNILNLNDSTYQENGFLTDSTTGQFDGVLGADQSDTVVVTSQWSGCNVSNGSYSTGFDIPKAVNSKIFVFGEDQSYGNETSKFGEYRLLVKYPQPLRGLQTAGGLQGTSVVPNITNTVRIPDFFEERAASLAESNIKVKISFGDFYYPNVSSALSYGYKISSNGQTSAGSASIETQDTTVWAKEWAMEYVTQFYTDSELSTVYPGTVNANFYSYSPLTILPEITPGPAPFNTDSGTENSSPLPIGVAIFPGGINAGLNQASRLFVAQFDGSGKKIKASAIPSTGLIQN